MILMYHNIDRQAKFNTVSIANFEQQLAFIKDTGFDCLPYDDYVLRVRENRLPKNAITLTFDDAYRSYRLHALPLMESQEVYSALFVPTGHVGGTNAWDTGETEEVFEVMDWDELRNLSQHPLVTLGSHSVSHPHLSRLSPEKQAFEATQSRAELEQHLDQEIRFFSYPFGQLTDFNAVTIEALKQAGYTAACSTLWSLRNAPKDLFQLNRIDIDQHDSMDIFRKKLTTPYHRKYVYRLIKDLIYG